MFIGLIKTKDVLLHPFTIISMRGVKGYLKILARALSFKKYKFIGMTQNTEWIDLNEVDKKTSAK